jgi:Ankyrin repeats (3 copies)
MNISSKSTKSYLKIRPSSLKPSIKRFNSESNPQKAFKKKIFDQKIFPDSAPRSFSPIKFQPNTKYYIELTSNTNLYDLRGKEVQKDMNSIDKILNFEGITKKKNEIEAHLKVLISKNSNKTISTRQEMLIRKKSVYSSNVVFFNHVKRGNLEEVALLIDKYPDLVKEVDSTDQTALHWACRRGHLSIVKYLLSRKASVLSTDVIGRTPEDIARSKNFLDIIEVFNALRRKPRYFGSQIIRRNQESHLNIN